MFDCKNLKMNFIVFSAIVLHFSILQVSCRSVHLDIDSLSRSEVREDKDLNHDSGISGRFSWKRLKPILHRELQRIRNVKGTNANKINQDSTETTVSIQLKKNDNFSNASLNADKNKDIYSKNDTGMTNTSFIMSELTNSSSHNEETIDESDVEEEFAFNTTHDQIPELDQHPTTSNFPDITVSGILHQTELSNTTFVKTELTNNSSHNEETIDESDVEEDISSNMTPLLDQHTITSNFPDTPASDILYQTGMANISFVKSELINNSSRIEETTYESDVETKKNLLLMELLTSQSVLIDDFTDEDDSDFTTLELDNINESEEDETTSNGEVSFSDVTSLNTDGFNFTTLKLSHINQSKEYENTKNSTILNTDENDSDFMTLLPNNANETTSNEEVNDFNNDVSQTENSEFITHEVKTIEDELELLDSVQNDNGTEWTNTEPEHPMCPDPGWCVFWFLGLEDTCAKDSHCHGSLICCKIGCTKTCIDADR